MKMQEFGKIAPEQKPGALVTYLRPDDDEREVMVEEHGIHRYYDFEPELKNVVDHLSFGQPVTIYTRPSPCEVKLIRIDDVETVIDSGDPVITGITF